MSKPTETLNDYSEPFCKSESAALKDGNPGLAKTPVFEPEITPESNKNRTSFESILPPNPQTPSFLYDLSTTTSFSENSFGNSGNGTFDSAKNFQSSPLQAADELELMSHFEKFYIEDIAEKVSSLNYELAKRSETVDSEFISANDVGNYYSEINSDFPLKNRTDFDSFINEAKKSSDSLTIEMSPSTEEVEYFINFGEHVLFQHFEMNKFREVATCDFILEKVQLCVWHQPSMLLTKFSSTYVTNFDFNDENTNSKSAKGEDTTLSERNVGQLRTSIEKKTSVIRPDNSSMTIC